jgi:hypothetical protein
MKKLFIIALLMFYLGSISGMRINVHYCCGKIKYVTFIDVQEKESCCGSKKKSKRCCHDKVTHVKIADQHESAKDLKIPGPASKYTDLFTQLPVSKIPAPGLPYNSAVPLYKPPVRNVPPLYLFNAVLLI